MVLKPAYYAVIFSSKLNKGISGYNDMANELEDLLKNEPGFLGMDSARNEDSESAGITVCYWTDLESIKNWKNNDTHLKAQQLGKAKWYSDYTVRICKVEKEYFLI